MSRGWVACLLWLLVVPVSGRVAEAAEPKDRAASQAASPPTAPPPALSPPDLEISGDPAQVDLPAIPPFALPSLPDGLRSPFELLVAGSAVRGTRVRVAGYITWIYDCASDVAAARKLSRARAQRMIDDDPSLCERPKFYLGDARKTARERSLWVVDVPRRPFKVERERLPAEDLKSWPAVPKLTLGAYVVVTGTLALESPHRERNSDGLVVYEGIESPPRPPPATSVEMPDAALPAVPQIAPPAKSGSSVGYAESIRRANAGFRAYGTKQYDAAITEFEAAVQAWDGNHSAWYELAGAHAQRREYATAAEAARRCVELAPDAAMYWLLRGRMLYEATLQEAQTQEASRQGRPVDDVTIDRSKLDFTLALQALLVATHLEDRLWRAHYVIGRIFRDRGEAKSAARYFTRAIALRATDRGPYVALCELYRRWQYLDEALAIAELGSRVIPSSADLWFEVGIVQEERGDLGKAIDGFTQALDVQPDHSDARFQRGEAYFRKKDLARAKADLEAFLAVAKDTGDSFEIREATTMLATMKR